MSRDCEHYSELQTFIWEICFDHYLVAGEFPWCSQWNPWREENKNNNLKKSIMSNPIASPVLSIYWTWYAVSMLWLKKSAFKSWERAKHQICPFLRKTKLFCLIFMQLAKGWKERIKVLVVRHTFVKLWNLQAMDSKVFLGVFSLKY